MEARRLSIREHQLEGELGHIKSSLREVVREQHRATHQVQQTEHSFQKLLSQLQRPNNESIANRFEQVRSLVRHHDERRTLATKLKSIETRERELCQLAEQLLERKGRVSELRQAVTQRKRSRAELREQEAALEQYAQVAHHLALSQKIEGRVSLPKAAIDGSGSAGSAPLLPLNADSITTPAQPPPIMMCTAPLAAEHLAPAAGVQVATRLSPSMPSAAQLTPLSSGGFELSWSKNGQHFVCHLESPHPGVLRLNVQQLLGIPQSMQRELLNTLERQLAQRGYKLDRNGRGGAR